jgi:Hypervirulence associated proteins TUDOR domain
MTQQFKQGEHVQWKTSQGTTSGKVVKKLTSPTDINGHHVVASQDEPQYLVESDKTGKQAAHKPDALQKVHE